MQQMFYCTIPADVFWDFWKNNAVTNGGQDPGLPGPTIFYEDRMGVAKDLELLTWRSEGYEYKGTAATDQERTNASLRETTLDIDARETTEKK